MTKPHLLTGLAGIIAWLALATGHGHAHSPWPTLPADTVLPVVYNGYHVRQNKFGNPVSFVAFLEIKNQDGSTSLCTGVAIDRDVVVTAGHCLTEAKSVKASIFTDTESNDTEDEKAKSWRIHPEYNAGHSGRMFEVHEDESAYKYNDIAVVILERPALYANGITLAPRNLDVSQLPSPQIYSWGRGMDPVRRMRNQVEFMRLERPTAYPGMNNWHASVPSPMAMCVGDSGGPVTILAEDADGEMQHYLIGINVMVSRLVPPDNEKLALERWKSKDKIPKCGKRASFVSVGYHVDWIRSALMRMNLNYRDSITIFGE